MTLEKKAKIYFWVATVTPVVFFVYVKIAIILFGQSGPLIFPFPPFYDFVGIFFLVIFPILIVVMVGIRGFKLLRNISEKRSRLFIYSGLSIIFALFIFFVFFGFEILSTPYTDTIIGFP